jgi:ParB/RepB/Spo0J family partition protein
MKIPLSQVQPHPLNETIYDLSNIDDLVVSIGEVGLLTPVVVNQQYQLISGHRRIEAVRRLGWDEVDVEVIETASEDEEKSLLVHFNKQRVKTSREIINEAETLRPLYAVGQGKRSDLTSVRPNKSSGRDALAEAVGVSSSQLGKLLFIQKENSDFITAIDDEFDPDEYFANLKDSI